jgi:hypothetical protein
VVPAAWPAIEPVSSPSKQQYRLARCFLKTFAGNQIEPAAGGNVELKKVVAVVVALFGFDPPVDCRQANVLYISPRPKRAFQKRTAKP